VLCGCGEQLVEQVESWARPKSLELQLSQGASNPCVCCVLSCLLQRAPEFISECERLKVSLLAKDVQQPKAHTYNRPAEAVRIDDSGNNAQGTSECYSDATA